MSYWVAMNSILFPVLFASGCFLLIEATHFEGGTISWKVNDASPTELHFQWSSGWYLQKGPCGKQCTPSMVGQFGSSSMGDWKCSAGCQTQKVLAPLTYTITGINTVEEWEQGSDEFVYEFGSANQYEVSFRGGDWRALDYGTPGKWSLTTKIDLGLRTDTDLPNSSPKSTSSPIYRVQYGCAGTIINVPMLDADGDSVRCRWAKGDECATVCKTFPASVLTSAGRSCTLKVNLNDSVFTPDGWYAVAIQVEDFLDSDISMGSRVYKNSTALSSVPVQFLVYAASMPSIACNAVPEFVAPTKQNQELIMIEKGTSVQLSIHVQMSSVTNAKIDDIVVTGPAGGVVSSMGPDSQGRADVVMKTYTWKPSSKQMGGFNLCFQASDTVGKASQYRCVALVVAVKCADPGKTNLATRSNPTQTDFYFTNKVTFTCVTGHEITSGNAMRMCQMSGNFNGKNPTCTRVHCPTPFPIPNGDVVGNDFQYQGVYTANCSVGYEVKSGNLQRTCQADRSWTGAHPACMKVECPFPLIKYSSIVSSTYGSTPPSGQKYYYNDTIRFECKKGYLMTSGRPTVVCASSKEFLNVPFCEELDECASTPCLNGGMCVDMIGQFSCSCVNGFIGSTCQTFAIFGGKNITIPPGVSIPSVSPVIPPGGGFPGTNNLIPGLLPGSSAILSPSKLLLFSLLTCLACFRFRRYLPH